MAAVCDVPCDIGWLEPRGIFESTFVRELVALNGVLNGLAGDAGPAGGFGDGNQRAVVGVHGAMPHLARVNGVAARVPGVRAHRQRRGRWSNPPR